MPKSKTDSGDKSKKVSRKVNKTTAKVDTKGKVEKKPKQSAASADSMGDEIKSTDEVATKKKPIISLAHLRRMPKKDYMNPEQLEFFRDLLLQQKEEAEAHIAEVKSELASEMRTSDENDIASLEEERMIKLRIIDRESKLIPKILYSLRQIEDGTYGYCEETGEPIGIERLLLRPTATLSIAAKAFHEQKEKEYFD